MKVIQSFGVWSVARTFAGVYAALGLLIGAIFALVSFMGAGIAALFGSSSDSVPWIPGFLGVGAVILFPLIYGAIGLIGGAIAAAVYNFVAGRAGGIEVYLSDALQDGPAVPLALPGGPTAS